MKENMHQSDGKAERIADYQQRIRHAIAARRQAIVFELARMLVGRFGERDVGLVAEEHSEDRPWRQIESLSQLRATVGGRFQNLKRRWVKAGFPLREHRGDREGVANIDETAWVELALWMGKQGFESRLGSDSDPWLFEVREIADQG